jgi:hypothetical protein
MEHKLRIEFKLYLGMSYLDDNAEVQEIDGEQIANFLLTIATPLIPAYTLINTVGSWEGTIEPGIILIRIGSNEDRVKIKEIGTAYKARFRQDAVYLTETMIETEVI